MSSSNFAPGTLIKARGREWMVLSSLTLETIRVRPLSGSEEDQTLIYLPLELEPVTLAQFPNPHPLQIGSHETAVLLRDAILLSLRRGAGPFRSFGQIAVEPRAYQLVPLLMALKLDTVRLLIADDVGVGKTIEAGLIARELIDRGDIEKFSVLCPPHLVDQWVSELEGRFHIRAAPVTASSAARLERNLPMGESIFSAHPFTVVSLDYIKSEKRRSEFLRACPELVIVDEAHTCTMGAKGRHQRYELLKGLSLDSNRHLIFLTATPHSGDEQAFYKLLGLLDVEFEKLSEASGPERERIREKLSKHFVQRRRPDIDEWNEGSIFPVRETSEITYKLTGKWQDFLDHVLDYCAEIVATAGTDERKQRLNFWGTLSLLRCVSSSPQAAIQALRNRSLSDSTAKDAEEHLEDQIFDGDSDRLLDNDQELTSGLENEKIKILINEALELSGQKGDPKLKELKEHLSGLIKENFNPVVFCRFIATAHYLKVHLANEFKGVTVEVVTSELTADERKEKVDSLQDTEQRILIATDCLSEGVNLQHVFDAVIHYDLSWNPTRHEQREGRVDRFGQNSKKVRATLIYGENNPVDGAVLQVILRKAESIRKELGVPVPLPDDNHKLTQALMKAVLLRTRGPHAQMEFDFSSTTEAKAIETVWKDVAESAKKSRTVFAQKRLKPEDVLPEWKRTLSAIGGTEDVKRFTIRSLARLGAAPEHLKFGFRTPLTSLPIHVRERLEQEGMAGVTNIDFTYPARGRCKSITRSHPLVHILADSLLEQTLRPFDEKNKPNDPSILGRTSCWISKNVQSKTTVLILRLRHQLISQVQNRTSTLLVEEASSISWEGTNTNNLSEGSQVLEILNHPPDRDPPKALLDRAVSEAVATLSEIGDSLNKHAEKRAQELLTDHRRVREAADARGRYSVTTLLPPDIIGVYIILPAVE